MNLAWSTLVGLLIQLKEKQDFYYEYYESYEEENEEIITFSSINEYWKKAQRPLSTALSLIQQGTEFLLKGHIASVSPYLLISGDLNNHSNKSDNGNIRFSDFKIIDAQDLIKVYNITSTECLPDAFKLKFEKLRSKRNRIMHSIDSDLKIEIKELFIEILDVCDYLVSAGSWIENRKRFIQNEPQSMLLELLSGYDHIMYKLAREIGHVVDLLEPAEVLKYFNLGKNTPRRYICPVCYWEAFRGTFSQAGLNYDIPRLAQLKPNEPTSTSVYCIVCNESSTVVREDCSHEDCQGNVIEEEGICLTCGFSPF